MKDWQKQLRGVQKELKIEIDEQVYLAYDFIAVDEHVKNVSNTKDETLNGHLKITLNTVSPFVAVNSFCGKQVDPSVIPASSIRGAIRSAAEIIWNDVLTVTHLKDELEKRLVPSSLQITATSLNNHGLANHLFGFVVNESEQSKSNDEKNRSAFASKLIFTDAQSAEHNRSAVVTLKKHSLSTPNGILNTKTKKMNPAYVTKDERSIAGRKVYLAGRLQNLKDKCKAQQVPNELQDYVGKGTISGEKLTLVYPNTAYSFKIYFNNICKQHLADLIRVLELNDTATHAIGKGKPLGFGRVKLTVEEIQLQSQTAIFDLSNTSATELLHKKILLKETDIHEEKRKQFELFATLARFDDKKAYFPAKNKGKNGKLVVAQYTKYKKKG